MTGARFSFPKPISEKVQAWRKDAHQSRPLPDAAEDARLFIRVQENVQDRIWALAAWESVRWRWDGNCGAQRVLLAQAVAGPTPSTEDLEIWFDRCSAPHHKRIRHAAAVSFAHGAPVPALVDRAEGIAAWARSGDETLWNAARWAYERILKNDFPAFLPPWQALLRSQSARDKTLAAGFLFRTPARQHLQQSLELLLIGCNRLKEGGATSLGLKLQFFLHYWPDKEGGMTPAEATTWAAFLDRLATEASQVYWCGDQSRALLIPSIGTSVGKNWDPKVQETLARELVSSPRKHLLVNPWNHNWNGSVHWAVNVLGPPSGEVVARAILDIIEENRNDRTHRYRLRECLPIFQTLSRAWHEAGERDRAVAWARRCRRIYNEVGAEGTEAARLDDGVTALEEHLGIEAEVTSTTGPLQDARRCGLLDPRDARRACILREGHDGPHRSGLR